MTANISSLSKGLVAHFPLNGDSDRSVLSSTDILAGLNFASGWDTTGITVNSATSWTAVTGGGPFNASKVEVGKKYRLHLKGTTTASSFRLTNSSNSQNLSGDLTGSFDVTIDFIPILTSLYFRNANVSGTTTTLTEFSIREITSDLTGDITPNANHGTNNGAILSTGRKGEANGSYYFDGVNDYIPISDYDINNSFSTSVWIKPITLTGGKTILSKWGRSTLSNFSWLITMNIWTSGAIHFLASSDGINYTRLDSTVLLNENEWNHVLCVKNGTTMNIYINGVLSGTKAGPATLKNSPTPLTIGCDYDPGSASVDTPYRHFNGSISDVRIYNRALEEDEIKLLYDSFKPEIATSDLNKGLVGHWMLDSENGAKDLTPNGNHGTANGGVTIGGTTDRKGKTGGATEFDGTDDYVKVNEIDISSATISMWIKLNELASTKGAYNSICSWLYQHNANNFLYIGDGYDYFSANILNTVDVWTHLVVSFPDKTNTLGSKLYVNGILIRNVTQQPAAHTISNFSEIGRKNISSFSGDIQDLRIYNRQLSVDEIKLLYDQYKPKEASIGSLNKGLVLDMPLTTKHMKSNTKVSDLTPYGNDGTVSGAIVGSQYTSFDGVDDYIGNNNYRQFINGISYSMWANPYSNPSSAYGGILTTENHNTKNGSAIWFTNNKFYFGESHNGKQYTDAIVRTFNKWYYLTLTYNGTAYNFYVDGILTKTQAAVTNYLNVKIYVGRLLTEYANYYSFNGSMSNVRIYNRALSEEEVKLLYEKGRY